MRNLLKKNVLLVAGALVMSLSLPLRAQTVIYNNSVNDQLYRFNPGTTEIGDEILLANTERYLTLFSFEFWGTNTADPSNTSFAGAVQARVRFYQNDGPVFNGYATPGTLFYDSGWYGGFAPTPRSTLVYTEAGGDFPGGGLYMPVISNMTWSVQFQGMGATDSLGVDIYSPPVVGQNYDDYWEYDSANNVWTLLQNPSAPNGQMNFGALMEAVPEPSALALSLVGGLSILAMTRRLRRKE